MTLSDLLTPWLLLAAVLIPFIFAEKWIHSHLYGVGWLLTNDNKSATALYYLILLPGVFVHEFVQWLVAGALNVPTKRVMAWPEAQKDGTLRLDFVQIRKANWVTSAIIGAAPLIVGITIVWYISNRILNLEALLTALGTGEMAAIGSTIQDLGRTADFYLWLYLMFAISNAMIPTPSDRKGWPLLIGIFAVCIIFLVLIGVGDVLMETFTGPVAHALNILTTALATVLVVELAAILSIGFFEEILERATKRKFVYSTPQHKTEARQPGSNLPLPPGTPLPSIYNLKLPVPDPSIQPSLAAKAKRRAAAARPETMPDRVGMTERPAITSTEDRPLGMRPRPEFTGASAPEEKPTRNEPAPGFQRPSTTGSPDRPGAFSRPGAPTLGPSRIPPGKDDEIEEEPTSDKLTPGIRRPSTVGSPDRPGAFSRPGAPTLGPSRTPPRENDEAEEQPPGFRRPSAAPPDRPGAFSRPGVPALGPSRIPPTEEEIIEDEDESVDDEEPTTFRRPLLGAQSRNKPFLSPVEDDDGEDEDPEDVEYVDFDDL